MSLRATVRAAFAITGRGCAVVLENGFEGNARRDEIVEVPLADGTRRGLRVRAVEFCDGHDEAGKQASWVGLMFAPGELAPEEVKVGAELRTPEFAN